MVFRTRAYIWISVIVLSFFPHFFFVLMYKTGIRTDMSLPVISDFFVLSVVVMLDSSVPAAIDGQQ